MAKKQAPPATPADSEPEPERVTIINLKGAEDDRDRLKALSRRSGVPISTIARRGIAMWEREWAARNGAIPTLGDWLGG